MFCSGAVKFNVRRNHLQILLNCRFWFPSWAEPVLLHFFSTPGCASAFTSATWFIASMVVPEIYHTFESFGGTFKKPSCPGLIQKQLSQNSWGWKPSINWFQEPQVVPMFEKILRTTARGNWSISGFPLLGNFGYSYFTQ